MKQHIVKWTLFTVTGGILGALFGYLGQCLGSQ
ncbi:MAG: DUF6132 family protein [Pelovirga sp.]